MLSRMVVLCERKAAFWKSVKLHKADLKFRALKKERAEDLFPFTTNTK